MTIIICWYLPYIQFIDLAEIIYLKLHSVLFSVDYINNPLVVKVEIKNYKRFLKKEESKQVVKPV